MHRLTALLVGALRLIGSAVGFGGRLIADEKSNSCPSGDQPLPETKTGADQPSLGLRLTGQAEGISKQSRQAMHQWLKTDRVSGASGVKQYGHDLSGT